MEYLLNVLAINCGSSSLKYALFDWARRRILVSCSVERIGEVNSRLQVHTWNSNDNSHTVTYDDKVSDHRSAFLWIDNAVREAGMGDALGRIAAIGHRVVHGGERFKSATRIDAAVLDEIRDLIPLAPLHNPVNLMGIEICLDLFPIVPQVAVFDTAFHQTIPPYAYHYALPRTWYTQHRIRRYGFHGTSHAYVARRAAQHLKTSLSALNLITLHLGNGASAAAISCGRSVDTSMGMTPMEGLIMGTRCGDLDPAVIFNIARATGNTPHTIEDMLNHDSGLKGICGDNDMREVISRAARNDTEAELALAMFCYRIRKYIGAYCAVLGKVDALVFTGGIGENASVVRATACANLEMLGIRLDPERNVLTSGDVSEIQSDDSDTKILVVATDEEQEIVEQTLRVVERDPTNDVN